MALIVLLIVSSLASILFAANVRSSQTALPVSYAATNPSGENFTIIVLPDTQGYVKYYPWILDNQTEWIVDNVESLNIVFVTQLGDLVDNFDNVTQWENANRSMSKLDGNVPWGVLPGNHDLHEDNLTNYNSYFGYDRFSYEAWYVGTYDVGDNANSYQLFSAGGDDYLILQLQYNPSDDVLYWASNIIDTYPDRKVIVSTHDYLMGFARIGQRSDIGERIWHSLVKPHADQVFLVLCGHAGAEDLITDEVDGHVVYQMLADYQNKTNIENGWLRMLEFCPSQDKIFGKTYSPLLHMYKNDAQSEFTLDYETVIAPSAIPESPARENTVYIRANGSIEPSTAPIRRNGDTYVFEDNIFGSLVVERDNVVIDGAGFTLRGTGADDYGYYYESVPYNFTPGNKATPIFQLDSNMPYITPDSNNTGIYTCAEKLTVRNLTITEFWCGIELEYASDNCIVDNEITNNTQGIWIHYSSNNTISGNTISNNKQGITLTTSHDNIHDNNVLNNSEYGIKLSWSFNNLSRNNIANNQYAISLDNSIHNVFKNNSFSQNNRLLDNPGWSASTWVQDMDGSNLADGKPIYYWINKQDMTVPTDAGWVALINSTRIRVESLNLAFGQEILLISTTNSTINNNVLSKNDVCVYLHGSANNTIIENSVTDSYVGIQLRDSVNNVISYNNVTGNQQGIYLNSSSENSIQENEVTRNKHGVELIASAQNIISGNTLTRNEHGIHLGVRSVSYSIKNTIKYGSTNNTISRNNIVDNDCGVWSSLSSNNTFFSNNFLNNTEQVKVEIPSFAKYDSVNSWDDGKEGNYWSDYKDEYLDAKELTNSGIWDTSYVINDNNIDHYPLLNQIAPVDQSDDFPLIWVAAAIGVVSAFASLIYFTKFREAKI